MERFFSLNLLTNALYESMIKTRYGTASIQNLSNKIMRCLRIWNGFYNISFRAVEINIKGGLRNEKNH